jgi:multicomponent K+:H+ antiporter subunit E
VTWFEKLLPAPLWSAALFALWLTLARSVSAGQVLLGFALGLALPILTAKLRPGKVRMRRPLLVARFIVGVGRDVLMSSFEIGWSIATLRWRTPRSKFVTVPLELRDPLGLAALSMVTTVVPGTVWSELALDRSALLLHVWDVNDEAAFVARFKARYEQPLKEIFE